MVLSPFKLCHGAAQPKRTGNPKVTKIFRTFDVFFFSTREYVHLVGQDAFEKNPEKQETCPSKKRNFLKKREIFWKKAPGEKMNLLTAVPAFCRHTCVLERK